MSERPASGDGCAGDAADSDDPGPCTIHDGRLVLDEVDLGEVTAGLDGCAAWVLSHGALARRLAACDGPRTVSVGRIGPPAVLGMFATAGWWARCHTPRELHVARAAGFPGERLVASGRVKDDGFLKDALTLPVGVVEIENTADAENLARLASFLECAVPASNGHPPRVAPCELSGCGGLLSPVLRGPPDVALDAPWSSWFGDLCDVHEPHMSDPTSAAGEPAVSPAAPLDIWPLDPGARTSGTLEGLTSVAAARPLPARIHGGLARGQWALVISDLAFGRPFEDPAWPTPETIMTRNGSWRLLEERAPAE